MAMGKPVVVTEEGLEGIDAVPGEHVLLAKGGREFVNLTTRLLTGDFKHIAACGHNYINNGFNWEENLSEIRSLIHQEEASYTGDVLPCSP